MKRPRRRLEIPKPQIDTTSQADGPFSQSPSPPVAISEFNSNPNVDESAETKPSKQRNQLISNSSVLPKASNSEPGKPNSDKDSGGLFFW